MDPQPQEPRGLITDWDEHDVQLFLSHLGLPQYEAQVKGPDFLFFLFPQLSSYPNCSAQLDWGSSLYDRSR
jgi:hypothetical protein